MRCSDLPEARGRRTPLEQGFEAGDDALVHEECATAGRGAAQRTHEALSAAYATTGRAATPLDRLLADQGRWISGAGCVAGGNGQPPGARRARPERPRPGLALAGQFLPAPSSARPRRSGEAATGCERLTTGRRGGGVLRKAAGASRLPETGKERVDETTYDPAWRALGGLATRWCWRARPPAPTPAPPRSTPRGHRQLRPSAVVEPCGSAPFPSRRSTPFISSDAEVLIANHVYDYLVDIDAGNNIAPAYRVDGERGRAGVRLTLAEGVLFHDGAPPRGRRVDVRPPARPRGATHRRPLRRNRASGRGERR